jgi:hypothetical protein
VPAAVTTVAQQGEWKLVKVFTDRKRNHVGRYCKSSCGLRASMRASPADAPRWQLTRHTQQAIFGA